MEYLREIGQDLGDAKLKTFNNKQLFVKGVDHRHVDVYFKDRLIVNKLPVERLDENYISSLPFEIISVEPTCYLTWPCGHMCEFLTIDGRIRREYMSSIEIAKLHERCKLPIPEHFKYG